VLNEVTDAGQFALKAGDDFAVQFTFKVDGVPQDMSAWTFASEWRSGESSDNAVPFAVDQSTASQGVVILSLTPDQTRAMGHGGVFDLQGTDGGQVRTFLTGSTVWSLDVTRV
jgi:hypothetical protein